MHYVYIKQNLFEERIFNNVIMIVTSDLTEIN